MTEWKAEVVVDGVPALLDEDAQLVHRVIPGPLLYSTKRRDLRMVWRFTLDSPYIQDAIAHASLQWRHAMRYVRNTDDAVCTDFRVQAVPGVSG